MKIPEVGAPDPELVTSPIASETDEDTETLQLEVEQPFCYFNGKTFADGTHVRSDGIDLHCDHGIWVPGGPESR
jgi:hypothetical protein